MPRAKADQIVAELLDRVQEVNASAEYVFHVSTVIVYGSYVRGEPLLSDVDIAFHLTPKWPQDEQKRKEEERIEIAFENGRSFSNFCEQLFWPEREVRLHLKRRTRGLSLHPLDDFMGMEKHENFAYKVLLGDEVRIAEQLPYRRGWRDAPRQASVLG
jgi:predicted nucleotidyltransferase